MSTIVVDSLCQKRLRYQKKKENFGKWRLSFKRFDIFGFLLFSFNLYVERSAAYSDCSPRLFLIELLFNPKKWNLTFIYQKGGYFDPFHQLDFQLLFLKMFVRFPWRSKNAVDEPSRFGFTFHGRMLWLYRPQKEKMSSVWKAWRIPFHLQHEFTLVRMKDGSYKAHTPNWMCTDEETKKFEESIWKEVVPYTCVYRDRDGRITEIQEVKATLGVSEMNWYWKGFKWLPFRRREYCLDISLNSDIGSNRGTWKGGTMGWSVKMRYDDDPIRVLRKIEKEGNK